MTWIVFGLLTLIVLAALLWPLLSARAGGGARLDHDMEVYRDQLAELEAEAARGEIAGADADAARREIERRILRAADAQAATRTMTARSGLIPAIALAVCVPAATVALYLQIGAPQAADQPMAGRTDLAVRSRSAQPAPQTAEARPQGAPAEAGQSSIDDLAAKLAAKLQDNPEDKRGWMLLGRTYWELQRYADAASAYANAVALDAEDLQLQVAYGESLMFAARGQLIPAAQAAFRKAHAIDPKADAPRFYLAEADFRAGRTQEAYDRWLTLASDLEANSGGLDLLMRRLRAAAQALGRNLADDLPEGLRARAMAAGPAPDAPRGAQPSPGNTGGPAAGTGAAMPGPSQAQIAAAGQMSGEDRSAFIRSMVERLAARLEQEPDDFEGWTRLGRSLGVLGEHAKAADAYARAQALRPDDLQALWLAGESAAAAGRQMAALGFWERLRDGLPQSDARRTQVEQAIRTLQQQ